MSRNHGRRSRRSWKYRVIKKLKHRAQSFRAEATNGEERLAWSRVIAWLDSFRDRHRTISKKGDLGLKGEEVDL